MPHQKFVEVFHQVQQGVACHQKYLLILNNLYNSNSFDDFVIEYMRCLDIVFRQDINECKDNVDRCLNFAAKFCGNLVAEFEKNLESQVSDDTEEIHTHPFLAKIIEETLNYHNLGSVEARYHSCQFITLILKHIGEDANLDNNLCDIIQDAMLERITDAKAAIRMQAVTALLRLQDPGNIDCPVIKSFILCMGDSNPMVRREVVDKIAPCPLSIPKIIERLRDVDHSVRLVAYQKCSTIGPRSLKIVDRQTVMLNGINEENKSVKKSFDNNLLPKWLAAYDGKYINLLNALKLDADESDIEQTAFIHKKILEVFFKSQPLKDIIEVLPLGNDKLVPLDKISVEVAAYWHHLVNYLQTSEHLEDYSENIIPELTVFCNYIERLVRDKIAKQLDDWQFLEFQHILCQLLEMAEKSDLADEVGRNTLYKLITNILIETKVGTRVLTVIIKTLQKIIKDDDKLSHEMCLILSDIREPSVEQPPDPQLLRIRDFKISELRFKLNLLYDEQDAAVMKTEFELAATIKQKIDELKKEVQDLKEQFVVPETEKVTQILNDPETICRCLDILITYLQHTAIKKLSPSLITCKNEFVMPLIVTCNNNMDIYSKVFKCIVLYALLDRQIAIDNLKAICTPIIVYRLMPTFDKATMLVCIGAVSDLLRLYSTSIFSTPEESVDSSSNTTMRKRAGARRLYRMAQMEDIDSFDFDNITHEDIIDVILDILDDDCQEIRECATSAIVKLVAKGLVVSSSLISRLLLKWFNPLTEKQDQKIQQTLGISILHYAREIKGSAEILEKAVIPTLTSIGNAPKTSPLADIDVDNVLQFLAAITKIKRNEFSDTHKNLSYSLCYRIAKKPLDPCVPFLVKMLLYLEIPTEDHIVVQELVKLAELLLEDVVDRYAIKNINKYIMKLKGFAVSEVGDTLATIETTVPNTTRPSGNSDTLATTEVTISNVTRTSEIGNKENKLPGNNNNTSISNKAEIDADGFKTPMKVGPRNLPLSTSVKRCKQRGKTNQNANPVVRLANILTNPGIPVANTSNTNKTSDTRSRTTMKSNNADTPAQTRGKGASTPRQKKTSEETVAPNTRKKSTSTDTPAKRKSASPGQKKSITPNQRKSDVAVTPDNGKLRATATPAQRKTGVVSPAQKDGSTLRRSNRTPVLKKTPDTRKPRSTKKPNKIVSPSNSFSTDSDASEDTVLHTIQEHSLEMDRIDDDSLNSESSGTESFSSGYSTRSSTRKMKKVISETSSDRSSSESHNSVRKSKRKMMRTK